MAKQENTLLAEMEVAFNALINQQKYTSAGRLCYQAESTISSKVWRAVQQADGKWWLYAPFTLGGKLPAPWRGKDAQVQAALFIKVAEAKLND